MTRRSITIVLVANALLRLAGGAGGALVGFYLAALAERGLPVGAGLVGWLNSVANLAELLLAVPLGMLADRYSPRAILVISTLAGAGATQLFGATGAAPVFFISRSLESVAAVAGGPALLSFLTGATLQDERLRGRVMSLYELSLLGGVALGGVLGGILWDALETRAFAVLAVGYCIAALLFWFGSTRHTGVVPPATPRATHPLDGLRRALTDPALRRLAPSWLAVNALLSLWLTQLAFQLTGPPVAGQVLPGAFTARGAGLALLGYAVALAVGVLGWGFVLGRIPRARALRISLLALLAAWLLLWLLNLPLEPVAGLRGSIAVLLGVALMVGSGYTPAALTYLADITVHSTGRGAALGVYTLLFSLGAMLGSGLGGWLGGWAAVDGLLLGSVVLTLVALASVHRLAQPVDFTRA